MKLGITSKLFFAILASCVIVALAMAGGMRYSFNQGFLGYLNEQESSRVEALRPNLAKAYQENGSWDFLRGKNRLWFTLIRPPGMAIPDDDGVRDGIREERPEGLPPPRPESDLTGLNLRMALLDAQKEHVIGNPNPGPAATLKSIEVDGRTVGWIALVPFQHASTGADRRFQQQQMVTNSVIGAMAVLLAALVAYLLARMFLAPLKRMAASTHLLAAGDYTARVPVSSHDEFGRLAEDFNQLALTLEKNEQLRKAFMADVSHELRTPLAILKGELEAIEDGIRPITPETVRSLQAEVATLGKLVNDLHELSLSDAGALAYRKTRTDVFDVLRMAAASFQDRFAEKSIALELRPGLARQAWCDADPQRLRQLFSNVLENAFRYTDAGGRMIIDGSMNGHTVSIDFQDTKPGVPEDLLPHLFERFYRVEGSRNRATGGSGLGLAISRNITEAHQGAISARPSPLGGLWISITLPLAARM